MENTNKDPKENFKGYNEKYDKNLLIEHDYDGIRELDNPPPPWLMWLFYITIFWALGYVAYFHFFHVGPTQAQEYKNELAEAAEKYKATNSDTEAIILLTDAASLKKGSEIFAKSCAACHGPEGKGGIGVNLTDDEWIYGNKIGDLFKVIKDGTSKGMTSFSSLPDKEIEEVASFILEKLNSQNTESGNDTQPEE